MEPQAPNPTERFLRALTALGAVHDDRFLVAVSGGMDSMVLLHLAVGAGLDVVVAHVNYHLRGADSDADADLVRTFCEEKGISCRVRDIELNKHSRGHGVQTRAREERYAWFEDLRESEGLDFVLTAHHADDRLETFFINMLRGGGVRGLKSIPPRRDDILRPLLGYTKEELHSYALESKVPWREDISNRGTDYLRNKIRHNVLPALSDMGPRAMENLLKSVDHLGEANDYFDREAEKFVAATPWVGGVGKICDTRWDYLFAHPPLPLYVFSKWGFRADMLPEIEKLRHAQSGKKVFGQNGAVYRDRDQMLVSQLGGVEVKATELSEYRGEIFRPLHLVWGPAEKPANIADLPKGVACLDAATLQFPLVLRPWRSGDRFVPLGMKGFKKVSDFLVDEKVPLPQKGEVLVLESANGICWVVGHRIDDRFKIRAATTNIVRFET